jgi:hypothetical protein
MAGCVVSDFEIRGKSNGWQSFGIDQYEVYTVARYPGYPDIYGLSVSTGRTGNERRSGITGTASRQFLTTRHSPPAGRRTITGVSDKQLFATVSISCGTRSPYSSNGAKRRRAYSSPRGQSRSEKASCHSRSSCGAWRRK